MFFSAWDWKFWRGKKRQKPSKLRAAVAELVAAPRSGESEVQEKSLIANVLRLRDRTVSDVMVPRARIIATEQRQPLDHVVALMHKHGHSRLPVYHRDLDNPLGLVHIKDLITPLLSGSVSRVHRFLRKVRVAAPSMGVLDLLLDLRLSRRHMALVVDEYGDIDGLVTIEDLVEEIVGEIEDEHDPDTIQQLVFGSGGTVVCDARVEIQKLERKLFPFLSDAERKEDIDTLGGFVSFLAERVPARGELIVHSSSGLAFEVLEADPRRIKQIRIRNLPRLDAQFDSSAPSEDDSVI